MYQLNQIARILGIDSIDKVRQHIKPFKQRWIDRGWLYYARPHGTLTITDPALAWLRRAEDLMATEGHTVADAAHAVLVENGELESDEAQTGAINKLRHGVAALEKRLAVVESRLDRMELPWWKRGRGASHHAIAAPAPEEKPENSTDA